ncbi:protein kinase family protein [Streptomyces sp. NPDC001594]|uniref:protein kinase family protein n=1 Tax=Streptomyces sp. NPDC001594 TaxID=3364590 RepID=UPI0036A764BD
MPESTRLAAYGALSTSLALRSDRRLAESLDAAVPLGSGVGGRSALLEVDGKPVFVMRVPLTDLERLPEHARSTANLFGLPAYCQYGVGGPGFGAWRELAVHAMTTNWVLTGQHQGFPMMYHWRVLPDTAVLPEELADVERAVAYWGGRPEVGRRIEALGRSSAALVLFLEYIPRTLDEWLTERLRAGEESADRACSLVEAELEAGTSFMNARGLLHFDAHFHNILYDRCYTRSWLVNRLITKVYGYGREEREALIRACAAGEAPPEGPGGVRAILSRHAPLAVVMTDFYGRIQDESRQTPYPLEELLRALRADAPHRG